jgi:tetratricopeptide (TPR) repeat protein
MSEPRTVATFCPDLETVSAYIDGTIDPPTRAAVEAHLAECESCHDLVVETMAAVDDMNAAERRDTVAPRWRRGFYLGTALLAAAALVLAVGLTVLSKQAGQRDNSTFAGLVAAVGPERLVEPRLTGNFLFGPLRSQVRGAADAGSLALIAAAAEADNAAKSAPGPETRRAAAVAHVLLGDYDGAIAALRDACGTGDARCESDLGAAYLARATTTRSASDLAEAATRTRRALEIDPSLREAAFNEGLILERQGRLQDAAAAWTRYLSLDPDSPWAGEARRQRARPGA